MTSLTDFSKLGKPARSGNIFELSLNELGVDEMDHFAVLFKTKMEFDEDGEYRFGIASDDGAKLYIDNKLIIDNDGSHSAEVKYGTAKLKKGVNQIKVEYFEDYMGQRLEVYYGSANIPDQELPVTKFVE